MDTAPEETTLQPGPAISIRTQLALAELPRFFGSAFSELAACDAGQSAGPPFAIYHSIDSNRIDVEAVLPLRTEVAPRGLVTPIVLEGGPAVQIRHVGPYEELGATYLSLERWIEHHHRIKAGPIREVYLTLPSVPPAEHATLVVQPLQAV